MRYAIGARVLNNDGTICEGIFGYGKYGLSCILLDNTIKNEYCRIDVFTDVKEAQHYARHLAVVHRSEFKSRARKHHLDISQFRFFLIKVDSSRFPYRLCNPAKPRATQYQTRMLYEFA